MLHRQITSPVLVGRRQELEALETLLESAQAGRGGVALVGGDAGVGKTRLCRALKAEATRRQIRVIEGRSSAAEASVPYGPFMDALRFRLAKGEGEAAAQVEANAVTGDLAAAHAALQQLQELVAGSDYRAGKAALAQARGIMCAATAASDDAIRELRAAACAWRELDLPYETACASLLLAQQLIGTRAHAEGIALATEAAAGFDALGARLEVSRAYRVLRQGGVRVRRRRRRMEADLPAPLDRLTAREVEVFTELARGRTNKQIARTLSMSPRTVGNHVSSILSKLECATRTEASRLVLSLNGAVAAGAVRQ